MSYNFIDPDLPEKRTGEHTPKVPEGLVDDESEVTSFDSEDLKEYPELRKRSLVFSDRGDVLPDGMDKIPGSNYRQDETEGKDLDKGAESTTRGPSSHKSIINRIFSRAKEVLGR